jgi:ribosomal protein L21E
MASWRDFQKGDRVAEKVRVSARGAEPKRKTGTVTKVERRSVIVKFDDRPKDRPRRISPKLLEHVRTEEHVQEGNVTHITRDVAVDREVADAPDRYPVMAQAFAVVERQSVISKTGAPEIEVIPGVLVPEPIEPEPCDCGGAEFDVHTPEGCWDRCPHGGREEVCEPCIEAEREAEAEIEAEQETGVDPTPPTETGTVSQELGMTDEDKDQEAAAELALGSLEAFLDMGDELQPLLQGKREKLLREIETKRKEVTRIDAALAVLEGRPQVPVVQAAPDPTSRPPRERTRNLRADKVIGGRDHVTIERACAIVGCGKSTLYRRVQEGKLSRVRQGNNTYFPISELEKVTYQVRAK